MTRAATSRLKMNPQLGSPPTLEFRALGELKVDDTYQRSLETDPSQRLIRRIAQFWDWGLCQPLAVARRLDGALMVVDGQHRLAAAGMRGDIAHLPCVITAYANAGDEAAAFVALNQNRKPLQPLDVFKAALAADDETATAVQRVLARAGLALAPHTNWQFWKPGMLANVNALQSTYRKHGEQVLYVALKAVAIGFEDAVLQYAGTVFSGIVPLVATFDPNIDDALAERIGAVLRRRRQAKWVEIIRQEYATGVKWKDAATIVFFRALEGREEAPRPMGQTVAIPPQDAWCAQCDRRVSGTHVARCASPFCSMKAKAA